MSHPQRNRIGLEEVLLAEEGRGHLGGMDDYELFLTDKGQPGQQFMHGMSNNEYGLADPAPAGRAARHQLDHLSRRRARSWRDPTRPGFWHISYTHPHPPIVPLASYFERYRARDVDAPLMADWARDPAALPYSVRVAHHFGNSQPPAQLADMRRSGLCAVHPYRPSAADPDRDAARGRPARRHDHPGLRGPWRHARRQRSLRQAADVRGPRPACRCCSPGRSATIVSGPASPTGGWSACRTSCRPCSTSSATSPIPRQLHRALHGR